MIQSMMCTLRYRYDPEHDVYAAVSAGTASTLCRLIVDADVTSPDDAVVGLAPRVEDSASE
jgi:hypothetical protein